VVTQPAGAGTAKLRNAIRDIRITATAVMSSKFYLQVSFQKYAPQIAASKQSKKLRKILRRSHATIMLRNCCVERKPDHPQNAAMKDHDVLIAALG
jgi:hypothetical protein